MEPKISFSPEMLSLRDYKIVKAEFQTPEDFDETRLNGFPIDNELILSFNFELSLIKVDYKVEIKTDSGCENECLSSFEFVYIFGVENLTSFANPKDETKETIILDPILANSVGSIAYSTSRGILITRLQGTPFKDFLLPITDVNNLIYGSGNPNPL